MKSTRELKPSGFTLVELLVVIVIIASLAALGLTIGPRMMARAKATESMQNIRQISPLLTTYASEHSMTMPPILGNVTQSDGTTKTLQWNEVCLALLYPDTDPDTFKDKAWWGKNKVILRNPMFKDADGWTPLNPGYAMNEMIVENIRSANPDNASSDDPLSVGIPLTMVTDPARTPLVAPFSSYHFRFDDSEILRLNSGKLKNLLSEGKLPVLFVDGHLEVMTPKEYKDRKLAEMPLGADGATP